MTDNRSSPAQEATPPREDWASDLRVAAFNVEQLAAKGDAADRPVLMALASRCRAIADALESSGAAPTPEASGARCDTCGQMGREMARTDDGWCCVTDECLRGIPPAAPAREASSAPQPLTAEERALVQEGVPHVGDRWAADKLLRYEATVAALTAERGARGQGQQQEH